MNALMQSVLMNNRTSPIKTHQIIITCYLFGMKVNKQNIFGQTALHMAVEWDNPQAVKLLLRLGADRYLLDINKRSPIDIARKNWNQSLLSILLGKKFKLSFYQQLFWHLKRLKSSSNYFSHYFSKYLGFCLLNFQIVCKCTKV